MGTATWIVEKKTNIYIWYLWNMIVIVLIVSTGETFVWKYVPGCCSNLQNRSEILVKNRGYEFLKHNSLFFVLGCMNSWVPGYDIVRNCCWYVSGKGDISHWSSICCVYSCNSIEQIVCCKLQLSRDICPTLYFSEWSEGSLMQIWKAWMVWWGGIIRVGTASSLVSGTTESDYKP